MAMLLPPFFSDPHSSKLLCFSNPLLAPTKTITRRNIVKPNLFLPFATHQAQLRLGKRRNRGEGDLVAEVGGESAVEDNKLANDVVLEEDVKAEGVVSKYDWTEEWYPLYLTQNVPDDAPLGLTVFDKQLVLYRDGQGLLRCHEDRCPHRLAKLSEGQLVEGRLECLYHGWQFEGEGKCVRIPQLPANARIPQSACLRTYEVRDSQGVVWVWMSRKTTPDPSKLPWFENFARPGFQDTSTTHELPYDHSILLENLMDPAHIPISHDRTDWTAKEKMPNHCYLKSRRERIGDLQAGGAKKKSNQCPISYDSMHHVFCKITEKLWIRTGRGIIYWPLSLYTFWPRQITAYRQVWWHKKIPSCQSVPKVVLSSEFMQGF